MSAKYGGKMRVSSCNCITAKVYFYEKQLILSYYFSTVLEGMSLAFLAELPPEESAPLFLGCANRKRELLGPAPALLSGVRGASQEGGPECPSPGSGPIAAQRPAASRLQSARDAPLVPGSRRRPAGARAAGSGTHPRSARAWGSAPRPAQATGVLCARWPRGGVSPSVGGLQGGPGGRGDGARGAVGLGTAPPRRRTEGRAGPPRGRGRREGTSEDKRMCSFKFKKMFLKASSWGLKGAPRTAAERSQSEMRFEVLMNLIA